jgi:hypothetical protein
VGIETIVRASQLSNRVLVPDKAKYFFFLVRTFQIRPEFTAYLLTGWSFTSSAFCAFAV